MQRHLALVLPLLVAGCSWSHFDDVGKNAPVVILKKPAKYPSFGASLAVATDSDAKDTRVLVGGSPGKTPASLFALGYGTSPTVDAADTGACSQDDPNIPCFLAPGPAALGIANVGAKEPRNQCFVLGAGKSTEVTDYGLLGYCATTDVYTRPVPDEVLQRVIKDELILQGDAANAPIYMAADKDAAAAMVAGAPVQKLAWYYQPQDAPSSKLPIQLFSPGKAEDSFGRAGAVLRVPSADDPLRRIVAVSAPDLGHVWLFTGDNAGAPIGCLGGITDFGRVMASGDVDDDGFDDLVVADDQNVTVISGAALADLQPASDITCSLAALPPHGILASFGCGTRDSIAGCGDKFVESLAVGDIDGDHDGEVIVGAPRLTAREKSNAGAVLVYDAEGPSPEALTDVFFLASAQDNDALGTAVVAAPIEGRDVVVAAAPGGSRVAVFYCSAILGGAATGSRCE